MFSFQPCLFPSQNDTRKGCLIGFAWEMEAPGDGLLVNKYGAGWRGGYMLEKALGLILNSEGMLRGTDNFYFILITSSFKQ